MARDNTELQLLREQARAITRATNARPIHVDGETNIEFARVLGIAALRAGVAFMQARIDGRPPPASQQPTLPPIHAVAATALPPPEVMTTEQVAEFLGVDRNTVYDYAGRGVIPHQRLGKRILFSRAALMSWLEASCKAASTRKG